MRPSGVRSKTAPQASSSRTRAGASWAWSWAMRQLLTYWPPRMVSAKWVLQLSRSSTLARAAATPPSAMTVWALPSSDLQTRPTETPAADASMAARRPAPPAPMTMTSCSWVWISGILENSPVVDHAGRAETDVDVGPADPEEAEPGPLRMMTVEAAHAVVGLLARRRLRELIHEAAHEVAQRVATERVARDADDVGDEHEGPHAEA